MNCPRCHREVESSSVLEIDGKTLAVHRCGYCVRLLSVEGITVEEALTFAVDANGQVLDPETLEPLRFYRPSDD